MSIDLFSNWNLIRTSGFLAYFLLTLSIAAGLMGKISTFNNKKPLMMDLHKFSGWIGLLTVIFHAVLLFNNHYVHYEMEEVLIPFDSDYAPVSSAFGTISFYIFLIVMATSDFFMQKLGRGLWKKLHWLVIPAWVLSVLHGVFIGTDSSQLWAIIVYFGGIVLVMTLLVFRFFESWLGATDSKKAS